MSEEPGVGHLFVYGTLRPGGGAPSGMRRTLEENADHLGTARVRGRLFVAGGGRYPALVLSGEAGWATGDLYRLRSPRRVLKALDRYEGRRPDGTGLYRRETVPVRLRGAAGGETGEDAVGGRRLRAWAYLYNRDTSDLEEIEDGDWMRR